jgi:hypothetical protein
VKDVFCALMSKPQSVLDCTLPIVQTPWEHTIILDEMMIDKVLCTDLRKAIKRQHAGAIGASSSIPKYCAIQSTTATLGKAITTEDELLSSLHCSTQKPGSCTPSFTTSWVYVADFYRDIMDASSAKWGWVTCGSKEPTTAALSFNAIKCGKASLLVVGFLRSYVPYMGKVSVSAKLIEGTELIPASNHTIDAYMPNEQVSVYAQREFSLAGAALKDVKVTITSTPEHDEARGKDAASCPNKFKLMRIACY